MSDIDSFFASVRLPSISHVTQALIRMLDSDKASIDEVCAVIARELVAEGQTDEMILAYFESRYGEWVLLEPRSKGNFLVWGGPIGGFAIGLILIALYVRRKRQKPADAPAPPPSDLPAPTDEYIAAVRSELER